MSIDAEMSRIPVRTPSRGSNSGGNIDQESSSAKEITSRLQATNLGRRSTTVSSTAAQPLKVKDSDGFRTPARPQRKVESFTASKASFTGPEKPHVVRKTASAARPSQYIGSAKAQTLHRESASTVKEIPKTPSVDKTKSSTGLREHIARARAELQKSAKRPPASSRGPHRPTWKQSEEPATQLESTEDPFAIVSDPFNQKQFKPDLHPVVDRGIKRARQDGRLNISNCELKGIPRSVFDMYKPNPSQVIDFSNADEPAWYEYVDLTYFNAADNEISEIGDDFVEVFGGVCNLDFHNNRLSALPDNLRQLSCLTSVNLAGNGLDLAAFKLVCQIDTIVELNFSRNSLQGVLDPAISALNDLTSLDISGNSLAGIGKSLFGCPKLQKLNLSGNKVDQITTSELAVLTSLVELDLSRNNISSPVIDSSMTFPRLEILNLAHNVLYELQASADHEVICPSLTSLVLLQNRLSSFDGITCSSLINLNIEGNHFTIFPEVIYDLPRLRHLDISDNRFNELDYKIGSLPLTHFRWKGNPVRMRGCFGMDTVSMLEYLRNRAPHSQAL